MKTLTDIVCALVDMMEAEEQDAFLASLAQGKRPTKPPRPMTPGERWWKDKLSIHPEAGETWIMTWTRDDLVDDFIRGAGWTKSRQGAATSMGIMLNKICPDIRRYDRKLLMPNLKQARRAFSDVFPAPRGAGQALGIPPIPDDLSKVTMGPRIE